MDSSTFRKKLGFAERIPSEPPGVLLTDADLDCLREIRNVLMQHDRLTRFSIALRPKDEPMSSRGQGSPLTLPLDENSLQVMRNQMLSTGYMYSPDGLKHKHIKMG